MAKELVSLCPETVNMSNELTITSDGLKNVLERGGIPFNVGSKYVLVPQLNHAQSFEGFAPSKRFALVEIVDGKAVAIRTIAVNALTQRVFGLTDNGPVQVKARLKDGLNRPDNAKWTDCVNERLNLGLTPESRAEVRAAATLQAQGKKECWVPAFETKDGRYDMKAENGYLIPETAYYNFWKVVSTSNDDVKTAVAALKADTRFAEFVK